MEWDPLSSTHCTSIQINFHPSNITLQYLILMLLLLLLLQLSWQNQRLWQCPRKSILSSFSISIRLLGRHLFLLPLLPKEVSPPRVCLPVPWLPNRRVIDSAATDHMSGTYSLFSDLQYSSSLPNVTLADGSTTSVSGTGTVQPSSSLSLDSVLYIPCFPFNLMSVSNQNWKLFSNLSSYFFCSTGFGDREEDWWIMPELVINVVKGEEKDSRALSLLRIRTGTLGLNLSTERTKYWKQLRSILH